MLAANDDLGVSSVNKPSMEGVNKFSMKLLT